MKNSLENQLVNQLSCFFMPAKGRFCKQNFLELYEKAFEFWFTHTHFALNEEKNDLTASQLSSDPYLSYDEFALLCFEETPVGIFMFRWIDRNYTPNNLLNELKNRFPDNLFTTLDDCRISKIMLMGNLVVAPNWRRSKIGFGIADMLMGLALKRFLDSDGQVLLTTTRNNRSTNTLCYRQGGQKYADNKEVFNVSSDIVLFYRDDVKPHSIETINHHVSRLWHAKKSGWIDMPLNFIGRINEQKEKSF